MNLQNLDRRWIFLVIFIGVSVPLFIPFGFRMEVSKNVQTVYDLVENTPEGDRILISFDYDPSSKAEIQPAVEAIIKHAIDRRLRIVCLALWPMGSSMADEIYKSHSDSLVYGVDFINLGYKSGGMLAIQTMGKNFREVFPKDVNGNSIEGYEIMNSVETLRDFSFIASISSGTPGMKEWIMVAGDTYNVPVTGATTAVSTPGFLPYINEKNQLHGLIGGLKAAAEYELLIEQPSTATAGMDAQSISHIIIIIFIIIGNISYYLSTKNKGVQS